MGEEEDFHIDGMINALCIYFMTEGMFILARDGVEIYFYVLVQTPLHYAAGNVKGDVVEILLLNGANINEKNVKYISIGETDDFEKEQREREQKNERGR